MSKRKILLADDSETVQKVVNLTFELEGIEVITFGDGDSAMEQFSAVAPDLVLADVNMPGLTGYEICQNIKSNEATKNTPVILLVGSFEPFDEERAMQVGADDYLTKPFQSIRQLVSKVNELLAPGKSVDDDLENFNETLKIENNSYQESDFGDPGMDDEMIQTSQIGSIPADETAKYQTPVSFQSKVIEEDVSKAQPLSADDWRNIYPPEQNEQTTEQTVYELAEEETESQATEEIEETNSFENDLEEMEEQRSVEPVLNTSDETEFSETNFAHDKSQVDAQELKEPEETETKLEEDFGIQPDDIDHFYQEPDYEEENQIEVQQFPESDRTGLQPEDHSSQLETGFELTANDAIVSAENTEQSYYLEIEETLPEKTEDLMAETEPEFAESNETERDSEENIETVNEKTDISSSVNVFDFDDFDLLDISFSEKQTPVNTQPEVEKETPETTFQSIEETEENETENVKNEVAEQLSGINLTAADIDAIAEKVVEKLSARMKE